ncbi:MAG: hypothetical protein KGL39_17435 [Patescibacteria group bacterium]|nr:hypothetical protein [Patescibacteria group bacterium]
MPERSPSFRSRETFIAFDAGSKTVNITTHNFALMRMLEASGLRPLGFSPAGKLVARMYDMPAEWLKIEPTREASADA